MLGAIIGDVIGSPYEWDNVKKLDFPLFSKNSTFTDDTVMTVATALELLKHLGYDKLYWSMGRKYSGRGYGGGFTTWLNTKDHKPYDSFGNGSAMRISPVGYAFDTLEATVEEAKKSAEVTHNHPEGIKGAQAVAAAIFMGRNSASKEEIKSRIIADYGYNLNRSCDEIRPIYEFDATCQGSVPEAIIAFLDSSNFEDAVRKAISLGGDSDTIACISGGIAEAFYKEVPKDIARKALLLLPPTFRKVIRRFNATFRVPTKFV